MSTSPIKSVLIVDDSRVARILIRNIILDLHPHWIITEAANGEDAIIRANLETPNYVTMDYNMPDMNGIEAAQQILRDMPRTVIALFTANIQESTQSQAAAAGVGFVGKPITEATVKQVLDFFLARS